MSPVQRAAFAIEVLQATHPESPAIGALSWVLRDTPPIDWASAEIEALASLTEDPQLGRAHAPAEEALAPVPTVSLTDALRRLGASPPGAALRVAQQVARLSGLDANTPAPPPAPRYDSRSHWSPERDAVLRDGWAECRSVGLIRTQVNALPGPPLRSVASVFDRAAALDLPPRNVRSEAARARARAMRQRPPPRPLIWTAERQAALLDLHQKGKSRADILEAVNALPGPPCRSVDAITAQTRILLAAQRTAPPPTPDDATTSTTLIWTPEREALLRREYPAGTSIQQIIDGVNALPGDLPVTTPSAISSRAYKLGLRRPAAAPDMEAQIAGVDAEDLAEAREKLRRESIGAKALADWFGWDLALAQAITTRLREELRTGRAAA